MKCTHIVTVMTCVGCKSHVGIALRGIKVATDVQVDLEKGNLKDIAKAINLGEKALRNLKQNLFFALNYNTVGVPVAAGILYLVFGLLVWPMVAALTMSLSSVSIISNAIRLKNSNLSA